MSSTLTQRQRAIYEFIVETVQGGGIPPTLTEIAGAFGLTSASGVADHLNAIERKGYIRRRPGLSRGIELVGVHSRSQLTRATVRVPVVGVVPSRSRLRMAGKAKRHLHFDGRVAPGSAIAVRVRTGGLEDRGILRGDYLIVVRERRARAGDLALAHLTRGTILVEVLAGRQRVCRADNQMEVRNRFQLLGRVVAVLRSMDGEYEDT
ncbi:MAG: hypothetical protein ACE5HV_10490 [Acidobacteriota bacterium]